MLQALSILKAPSAGPRLGTETFVFYLHYRVTFLMLMFACIVVSSREFFGDKIQCSASSDKTLGIELINSYCWAASTYSVSSAYYKEVGVEVPHPGVGHSEDESEYTYRNYYQYVHIILFFQAILFYFPHLICKSIKHDAIKTIFDFVNHPDMQHANKTTNSVSSVANTNQNSVSKAFHMIGNSNDDSKSNSVNCKPCNSTKEEKVPNPAFEAASTYIEERWGTHKEYALKYILCELMAVVNLLAQCYLLNVFLRGKFLGLGHFFVPYYNAEHLKNPIQVFPLVTNCYFKKFGASGFVDNVTAICVLPINALNVKIYLFIWIWFAVLLGLSFWSLLDLCLSWCLSPYRTICMRWRQLMFRNKVSQSAYLKVVDFGDFGDWFLLRCIKRNMDPLDFSRLMEVLLSKLSAFGIEAKEP